MTGRAYTQKDVPEDIAQYFVSELHLEAFSAAFQATVRARPGHFLRSAGGC